MLATLKARYFFPQEKEHAGAELGQDQPILLEQTSSETIGLILNDSYVSMGSKCAHDFQTDSREYHFAWVDSEQDLIFGFVCGNYSV